MPFVKLDCGMLDSSIWLDRDAREIFITALLMAEPVETVAGCPQIEVRSLKETGFSAPPGWYGMVHAAGIGIIHRAGMVISDDEAMNALERLGNPDPESRNPRFDGRRMVRIDGGYLILNYDLYRARDYTSAERSRRYRERKIGSVGTNQTPTLMVDESAGAVISQTNPPLCRSLLDGEPAKGAKREDATEKCRRMPLDALREENATKTPTDAQSPATGQPANNEGAPDDRTPVPEDLSKNLFSGMRKALGQPDYVAPTPVPPDTRTPMERICDWFKRRYSTKWSDKELRAFKESVPSTHPEDLDLLESYYTADLPKDKDYRRHEIQTLLNNWNGEIDRARQWKDKRFSSGPQTPVGRDIDREYERNQRDKEPLSILAFKKTDPEYEQNQRSERDHRDKENIRHLAARGMD